MAFEVKASVGHGGVNAAGDVRVVKTMLADLGFDFFVINGRVDSGLIMAIKLYQSIIRGYSKVIGFGVDGRVDADGFTARYLASPSSPKWQLMPSSGIGYINHELEDESDNHDYGTNWMADTIVGAGAHYQKNFLDDNPKAAPIAINDVSIEEGGKTKDHDGHQTGLSCDLRVPNKDGTVGGIKNPNTNRQYDRDAMRAHLEALQAQPLVSLVLFNDETLIREGLCKHAAGHGDHVHFQLNPKPLV